MLLIIIALTLQLHCMDALYELGFVAFECMSNSYKVCQPS